MVSLTPGLAGLASQTAERPQETWKPRRARQRKSRARCHGACIRTTKQILTDIEFHHQACARIDDFERRSPAQLSDAACWSLEIGFAPTWRFTWRKRNFHRESA